MTNIKKTYKKYKYKNLLIGQVIKEYEKTLIIDIKNKIKHKKYKKIVNIKTRYMVHDPNNTCCIGDIILFSQSRPHSSKKKWQMFKILKKNSII